MGVRTIGLWILGYFTATSANDSHMDHLTIGVEISYCSLCFVFLLFIFLLFSLFGNVIVRPLSTVGYTSVVASVIHSRQWSN